MPLRPGAPVRNIAIVMPAYAAVRAPLLAPVEHEVVAVAPRGRRIAAASEPASGSVNAKTGDHIARRKRSSQCSFCSSVPSFAIALQIIECTETVTAVPASTLASSSMASAYDT